MMTLKGKAKEVQKKHNEDVCKVDGDDNDERSNWDSESHAAFVRLCVEEKNKGNMPTTHFSTKGWETIWMLFNQETKKRFTRAQLKNHWDGMRKEWQAWIFLKQKTSGLGWDPKKNTHAASNEWWNEMVKVNKLVMKFKNKGLEHEVEYEELFSHTTATGLNAWTPSQGVEPEDDAYVPQPLDQTSGYNDIATEENIRDEAEDDNCKEIESLENDSPVDEDSPIINKTPTTTTTITTTGGKRKKKVTNDGQSYGSVRKGKRVSGADKLTDTLDSMIHHMERRVDATLSIINGSSVKETIKLLNHLPGVTVGSPLYFFALRLFAKMYNREVFINLGDNDIRLIWLKDMELREPPVYNPQLAQLPGGPSQLLAQPLSGFSPQFGQPSSGFSHQVVQPAMGVSPIGFSQFTTQPLGGFTQLLAQPSSRVIANEFSTPPNAPSPHSGPDLG